VAQQANPGLDLDRLLQTAQETQGASPATRGDDLYLAGMRRLVAAFERGIRATPLMQRLAKREIYARVSSHIGFERDIRAKPAIADVPVQRPLFIITFGRTGSTLLHNLLALAPGARAPLLWELWSPSPPPSAEPSAHRPRIAEARQRLDFLARAAPLVSLAHPMDPESPDECQWMMRHSTLWVMLYDIPEYWDWLKALSLEDLRRLYRGYRLQVQHLQLFRRGTWVSKSFSHLHFLPVLHDVFPDARVVRLHRDPGAAIPSLCSVAVSYRSMFSTEVDPCSAGAVLLDLFVDGMARSMALDRARPEMPVVDVHYDALIADPIGTVRRVHDELGYPYDAEFERAMRAYLERAAATAPYRHRYSLEQFGLSRDQVLDRTGEYLAWAEARCGRLLAG